MNRYNYIDSNKEHLHTLDGRPLIGTSSVGDILNKPGLSWWASGLAVKEFGCPDGKVLTKIKTGKKVTEEESEELFVSASKRLSEIKSMTPEQYMVVLDTAYRAHSVKLADSAQAGTDLHAELERYVKNTMSNTMATYDDRIMPFITWSINNVDKFLASEVNCYSERLWTGGIVDVVAVLKDGRTVIIDFKSAKEAYFGYFLQTAGYDIALSENGGFDKDGNELFVLPNKVTGYFIVPFGAKIVEPVERKDVEELRKGFESELYLYKLDKGLLYETTKS